MPSKILLDENLPKPLVKLFPEEISIRSVHDMGWSSYKNGALLAAMVEAGFDCLITADRNIEYQQNIESLAISLVVVLTYDNRLSTLKQHVGTITEALSTIESVGEVFYIDLTTRL